MWQGLGGMYGGYGSQDAYVQHQHMYGWGGAANAGTASAASVGTASHSTITQGQPCPYGSIYAMEIYRDNGIDAARCTCPRCYSDRRTANQAETNQVVKMRESTKKLIEEKTMANGTDNEILPDISLSRVLKWAVVLIVAMGLGRKVWEMFGPSISNNLHKALGTVEEEK